MTSLKKAWLLTIEQKSRFIWLYALGIMNGFISFYLFTDRGSVSIDEWSQGKTSDEVLLPLLIDSIADSILFTVSLIIVHRVVAYAVGPKLTKWRFIKMQIPALMSSLFLTILLTGMLSSASSLFISDYTPDESQLIPIMALLTLSLSMFYFVFVIIYLQRYANKDVTLNNTHNKIDYFKALWLAVKESPIALLFFATGGIVIVLVKESVIFLNIEVLTGAGIFFDSLSFPLMLFSIIAYSQYSKDKIAIAVGAWGVSK